MRAMTVVALGAAVTAFAWAGPAEPDEKALLATIESLKARLVELETKVEELERREEPAAAPADLEARVTMLEECTEEATPEPTDFRVFWKEGVRMETQDGRFKIAIRGRIHNDYAWFDQDDTLRYLWDPAARQVRIHDLQDAAEFRRARLAISGEAYGNIEFKAEYDFADGETAFKDVYLRFLEIPYFGDITVGHRKEPYSLEELTSSNDITFMERALPNAFAPSRNTGISIHNAFLDDRMTYRLGVFRDTDDLGFDGSDGGYAVTGRVTGLPWYADDGSRLIHLGASYSHRNPDRTWRLRARPEAHLSDWRFVDTGLLYADDVDLVGLELAAVYGPLSFQTEYMEADIETRLRGNRSFDGYYAFASYLLTGEHRPYDREEGVFKFIKPEHNFALTGADRGWGAWEVALRYSAIDLTDGLVRGGAESNITVGLNWYLNANARIMFNYVQADIDHDLYSDTLGIFETRFQFHF